MVDESFFLTVAGIGMSFAGLAGLMNTLRRRGEAWAPMGRKGVQPAFA